MECFSYELLGDVRPVGVGRVNQIDAELDTATQDLDRPVVIDSVGPTRQDRSVASSRSRVAAR